MALSLGEGAEQNAPLGRAVIGGLLVATAFTLLFVPVMYSLLRRQPPTAEVTDEEASGGRQPPGEGTGGLTPRRSPGAPQTHVRPAEDQR